MVRELKKFLTISVINAKSLGSAKKIAFSVANSPLLKQRLLEKILTGVELLWE